LKVEFQKLELELEFLKLLNSKKQDFFLIARLKTSNFRY